MEDGRMSRNDTDELRFQKLAETLSNLVGLVVTFKDETWDEERRLFKKSYVSKGITATELEVDPIPHVSMTFTDGTKKSFFSFDNLGILVGEFGKHGSVAEYLENEAPILFG